MQNREWPPGIITIVTPHHTEAFRLIECQCKRILLIHIHRISARRNCMSEQQRAQTITTAAVIHKQHLYLTARQPYECAYHTILHHSIQADCRKIQRHKSRPDSGNVIFAEKQMSSPHRTFPYLRKRRIVGRITSSDNFHAAKLQLFPNIYKKPIVFNEKH